MTLTGTPAKIASVDRRQAFRGAGDLDEKVGLVCLGVQRLGLRYRRLCVVGEQRRHLQRYETVHRAGARMDRREQIRRAAKILYGEVEEQPLACGAAINLAADFRVVAGTVRDGVVEDRGVGGQAGDRQFVNIALQRAAIEQVASDVVEPQALAELVECLGCV